MPNKIIESIEKNIEIVIKNGLPTGNIYWLTTQFTPPDRKPSSKHNSEIQLMLAGIFQYKYPELDPKFMIGWDTQNKTYRVAITDLKHAHQKQEE